MTNEEIIEKLIKTGDDLDPWNQDDPNELKKEYQEMLQTVNGCKMIIDGLLDTIKDLMEG